MLFDQWKNKKAAFLAPQITFYDKNFFAKQDPDHDDPMVITSVISNYAIWRVVIDQGCFTNTLYIYCDSFKNLASKVSI